jgi:ABC-type nitrate/sulfonate/bicarbonate transport system ATPase subunit
MVRIDVKNIQKHFSNLEVIKNVSLEVQGGEIVCLIGPSGCGKTTLLRIIAKLISPDSGQVKLTGTLGIVFQEPRLLERRKVEENLEIPYLLCGKKVDKDRIYKLLGIVGLNEFRGFYPHRLSIGMQQRIAIIRALVLDPDILLLDEPFRGLDVGMRESLEDDVLRLHQTDTKSFLFVTHSIEEAIRVADRIILVSKRPMTVLKTITLPEASKPRNVYSEQFLPYMKEIYDLIYNECTLGRSK